MSYLNEEHLIRYTHDATDGGRTYIGVAAREPQDNYNYAFVILFDNEVERFISDINKVKTKYSEWKDIAKKNKVKEYSKII